MEEGHRRPLASRPAGAGVPRTTRAPHAPWWCPLTAPPRGRRSCPSTPRQARGRGPVLRRQAERGSGLLGRPGGAHRHEPAHVEPAPRSDATRAGDRRRRDSRCGPGCSVVSTSTNTVAPGACDAIVCALHGAADGLPTRHHRGQASHPAALDGPQVVPARGGGVSRASAATRAASSRRQRPPWPTARRRSSPRCRTARPDAPRPRRSTSKPLVTATMRTPAGSLPASSMRRRSASTRAATTSAGGAGASTRRGAASRRARSALAPDEQRLAGLVAAGPMGEVAGRAHRARSTARPPSALRSVTTDHAPRRAGRATSAPHVVAAAHLGARTTAPGRRGRLRRTRSSTARCTGPSPATTAVAPRARMASIDLSRSRPPEAPPSHVHGAVDALGRPERHRGAVGGQDRQARTRPPTPPRRRPSGGPVRARRPTARPRAGTGRVDHHDAGAVDLAQPAHDEPGRGTGGRQAPPRPPSAGLRRLHSVHSAWTGVPAERACRRR